MPIRADQVAGTGAFGAVPVFTGTLLIAVDRDGGRDPDRALIPRSTWSSIADRACGAP